MELVSVVIPTYNSESTLPMCLRSIRSQSYSNVEIVVVDNFSTDDTVKIARGFGARVYEFDCERAKAKNIGLRKSKGEYVLFLDSDMELTKGVIEECVNLMRANDRIGGVVIPERSVGKNFWVKVMDFEKSLYAGTRVESARFFRRDLAIKAGGFDESVVFFEEMTLPVKIERMGYDVRARIKSVILHHEQDFSLARHLIKKLYYGRTARRFERRYGLNLTGVAGRLGIFLRNSRFYLNLPISSAMLFLKCLEFIAVVSGILAGDEFL